MRTVTGAIQRQRHNFASVVVYESCSCSRLDIDQMVCSLRFGRNSIHSAVRHSTRRCIRKKATTPVTFQRQMDNLRSVHQNVIFTQNKVRWVRNSNWICQPWSWRQFQSVRLWFKHGYWASWEWKSTGHIPAVGIGWKCSPDKCAQISIQISASHVGVTGVQWNVVGIYSTVLF